MDQNVQFLNEIDSFSFMIVDPFDKTYNPAKSLKRKSDLEGRYLEYFWKTLHSMIMSARITAFRERV